MRNSTHHSHRAPTTVSRRLAVLSTAIIVSGLALAGCLGSDTGAAVDDPGAGGDVATETKFLYKDQAEAARVQTLVPTGFADEFPAAASFLTDFQIPGEDENVMMLEVAERDDDADVEQQVAYAYLDENPDLVASWIEGAGTGTSDQTIVLGIPGGWVGETIRSWMVEKVLTENLGYTVDVKQDLEAGIIYTGLASGDIDVFVGAWLPLQAAHYEKVDDRVVILGDNLPPDAVSLSLAVPQYVADMGITSIADLDANKEMFGAKVIGIEPGAGMMITAEERMSEWGVYGLDDWTLQAGSTAAMLAAYDDAVLNKEPIVVTIWKPHYAYAKWTGDDAMVDLADPGSEVPVDRLE